MFKQTLAAWLVLASAAFAQVTRISDRDNLDPSALDTPEDVYFIVDDVQPVQPVTRKFSMERLKALGHDHLAITTPTTLSGAESPLLIVQVDEIGDELTLAASQSIWITNDAQSMSDLEINYTGGSITLPASHSAWFRWDGSGHDVTPTPIIDDTMSDTSPNPVQNQVVKDYIDTELAGGFVTAADHSRRAKVRDIDRVVDAGDDIATALTELASQGYGTLWVDGPIIWDDAITVNAPVSIRGLDDTSAIIVSSGSLAIGASVNPIGATFSSHSGSPISGRVPAGSYLSSQRNRFIVAAADEPTGFVEGDWVALMCDTDLNRESPRSVNTTAPMPYELHRIRRIFASGPDNVYEVEGRIVDPMVPLGFVYTCDAGTDVLTAPGHNLVDDDQVTLTSSLPAPAFTFGEGQPTGLSQTTTYFVINQAGDDFQLSLTSGGAAEDITDAQAANEHRVHNLDFPAMAWEVPILTASGGGNGSNVVIDNLRIVAPSTTLGPFLTFRFLDGLEITNVRWDWSNAAGAPSRVAIDQCVNVRIHDCIVEANSRIETDSTFADFVVFGRVNNFRIDHCSVASVRSFATTIAQEATVSGAARRIGTPLNVSIDNNRIWANGLYAAAPAAMSAINFTDVGFGMVVADNTFILESETSATATGITNLSRQAVIRGNRFLGSRPDGTASIGVTTSAGKVSILNNEFRDLRTSVNVNGSLVANGPQTFYDNVISGNKLYGGTGAANVGQINVNEGERTRIVGNEFYGVDSFQIVLRDGDDHRVIRNTFTDCTYEIARSPAIHVVGNVSECNGAQVIGNVFVNYTGATPDGAAILFTLGDNHVASGNEFHDVNSIDLIGFLAGTGHRAHNNVAHLTSNTNFINVDAAVDETDITITGNTATGYGSGDLGISGTAAAAVTTEYGALNWIDP